MPGGAAADGSAPWRGVTTTGIYCRPTCGSRPPRHENVRLFESRHDAEAAGFRPCRRCRPQDGPVADRHAELVAEACRLIEADEGVPSVGALAHALGISEGHLHRLFKAHTGLTPRAFAQQKRAQDVRQRLSRGQKITETIYETGFGSSGRFYAVTRKSLGMTPSHYKAGGTGETLRFAVGQTSLGAILVASSEVGVAAILLGDDPDALLRDLQERFAHATLVGADAQYEALVARVVGLVEAPALGTALPLDLRGTAFQRRVWRLLQSVPAGSTISYDEIARAVGRPRAVGAVASACASNPLAVAIPCHRVVKADGSHWGYSWGLDRKRSLMLREGIGPPPPGADAARTDGE
ncbi:bifunctional DNA-binding transcriptional regulator/O6-methylguanine-DNA methyltransferase Ada [Azospirillum picis]|uniref:AraC family transcriptional regulator of adaptative response/methylated-DNA-[protein]-cysteine methyltransferase n=1 Tax=Azospirillum picis TaxID=488438 RepID=A0ABU0MQ57_9PROT|nr:bifunctional DNA-binding transcriptional regulator/O6-methylguanine-DNA methyltransferase Ada [Azospirillum picis]MBP2302092.1 AraC family transcriptional regulator of adaptative response/methylated-DNA-[protein]-cysteine methyltransferase [Azospirillum picis]MDQ0535617.1 AraC family transcriptional regulator of adaptative response/methylated-DNA-[protein]-cysteine methyltransferase [Azospirillum picis]